MLLDLFCGVCDLIGDTLDFAGNAVSWGLDDACFNYERDKKINQFLASNDGISSNCYGEGSNTDVKGVRASGTREEMEGAEEMEEEVICGAAIEKGYW